MRSFNLNETFFSVYSRNEKEREKNRRCRVSWRSLCTRRFLLCFRRRNSRLSVFFVSTFAALCPRSVDINPGQGGKNVCFGHVRSRRGGSQKDMARSEKERENESEDVGSTTFVSRSLIFSVLPVFSTHPYPTLGFSLSLHRALSSSTVLLSVLLRQRFPAQFRRSSHFFFPSLCGRTVEIQRSEKHEKERGREKRRRGWNDYGSGWPWVSRRL